MNAQPHLTVVGDAAAALVPPVVRLTVPVIGPDDTAMSAAFKYAANGWYVGPLAAETKNPGSVLGKGWQHQTSRDPQQIAAWFAGTDYGVFVHCGRSGALVVDVDDVTLLPEVIRVAIAAPGVPFQSTRANDPARGHYLFGQPLDRMIGNGRGRLGGGGYDIRGLNAVIVVAPSQHVEAASGGRYLFPHTEPMPVPVLPDNLAELLVDASPAVDAASDATVRRFCGAHTANDRPTLRQNPLRMFDRLTGASHARHDVACSVLPWAMREAQAGFYSATEIAYDLGRAFVAAMSVVGPSGRALDTDRAWWEYRGILSWAVGQALDDDPAKTRREVEARAPRNRLDGILNGAQAAQNGSGGVVVTVAATEPADGQQRLDGPPPVEPLLLPAPTPPQGAADGLDQLDGVEGFWQARESLAHLHAFARARRVSPWSLLGVALARVVAGSPPHLCLPPLVGGHASLNLFVALVGPSGSGKGAAEAAAREALTIGASFTEASPGSGEGIAHLYARAGKAEVERIAYNALLSCPEVDSLTALGSRRGATLLPQLRSAWSGEPLGYNYADRTKALPIKAHTYRLCLVLGVQPGRAAALLDDADAGTPQRFLWVPTTDLDAPALVEAAPPPREIRWRAIPAPSGGPRPLVLPVEVREAVAANRLKVLHGDVDALDGHELLCRLKVAAALALLDCRIEVSAQDWQLSEVVMGVSRATRNGVVAHQQRAAATANRARANADGERAVIVESKLAENAVGRIARQALRHLQRVDAGELNRGKLRHKLAQRDRELYDDAVEALVEAGLVELVRAGRAQVVRLRAGTGGTS